MKRVDWRIIVGIVLLVIGVITLLQSLGIMDLQGSTWAVVMGAIFAAAGAVFIYVFLADRKQWWALIPGCSLIGLAGVIILPMIPGFPGGLAPSFFLGMIGVSFWIIYLIDHENWWAIIPGGALFSIAALIGVSQYYAMAGVGVMFLGLAITFGLVALLPTGEAKNRWAWIPALVLLVMALFFGFMDSTYGIYVWPVALIIGGAVVLIRALSPRKE
jgi:hypothetical protein